MRRQLYKCEFVFVVEDPEYEEGIKFNCLQAYAHSAIDDLSTANIEEVNDRTDLPSTWLASEIPFLSSTEEMIGEILDNPNGTGCPSPKSITKKLKEIGWELGADFEKDLENILGK
jgi:hypothetical protein